MNWPVQECLLPVATVSEANRRDHWAVKAKRVKAQRHTAYVLCPAVRGAADPTRLA